MLAMESAKIAAFVAVSLSALAITVCIIMVPLMYQQLNDLQEDLGMQLNEQSDFASEIHRELSMAEDVARRQHIEQSQPMKPDFSIADLFIRQKRQAPGCSKWSALGYCRVWSSKK